MVELFRDFWWMVFPILWIAIGVWGSANSARRASEARELVKTYVAQGKEPPESLLRLAAQN